MSKQAVIALAPDSMTMGTVDNVIEISADAAIGLTLPANHILWDCGQYSVAIGDTWADGVFTRNGGALAPVLTAEEQIAKLTQRLDEADSATIELYELILGGE